jgi:hypothetical protein
MSGLLPPRELRNVAILLIFTDNFVIVFASYNYPQSGLMNYRIFCKKIEQKKVNVLFKEPKKINSA